MARKTLKVTISTKGRDLGKVFVITEADVDTVEWWAFRLALAALKNGVQIPDNILSMGFAGVMVFGVQHLLGAISPDIAKSLLEEMMPCVQIIPDPSKPNVIRALIGDDIEELVTKVSLRKEILNLHFDFFTAAAPST